MKTMPSFWTHALFPSLAHTWPSFLFCGHSLLHHHMSLSQDSATSLSHITKWPSISSLAHARDKTSLFITPSLPLRKLFKIIVLRCTWTRRVLSEQPTIVKKRGTYRKPQQSHLASVQRRQDRRKHTGGPVLSRCYMWSACSLQFGSTHRRTRFCTRWIKGKLSNISQSTFQ